ncbi:HAD-IIB family hydrolase [Escherichia coli]
MLLWRSRRSTRLQIQLYEALGERAHLSFSATDRLEVLPVGCNKGAALTVLTQHLGLSLRDCMAFGDAMNDREMLGSVGSGFIMAMRCRNCARSSRIYR